MRRREEEITILNDLDQFVRFENWNVLFSIAPFLTALLVNLGSPKAEVGDEKLLIYE
jgi:hypothetical protein